MYRMEGSVVKRFAEPLDRFIKIRKFSAEEILRLLSGTEPGNRAQYEQLVLNACLVGYVDEVLPKLRQLTMDRKERLERGLYDLVVDVNPALDITQVSIPVMEEAAVAEQIHLIEEVSATSRTQDQLQQARSLEDFLTHRVIGQREAAQKLARGIKKAVAGIRDPKKPVGSFFFVGQTGVGKTEMAKALAQHLYGTDHKLLRLDCSEYALPHEYAKLIGAPPGYIGYNEGGQLTERLKEGGGHVLLFDEIEKADRKVHNLLLQMLDEGFITDAKGQRIGCADAVIIMTSNLGAEEAQQLRTAIGFDAAGGVREVTHADSQRVSQQALRRCFSPEFLNRIDEIVTFRPLDFDDGVAIVRLMLQEVAGYAQQAEIRLACDNDVERWLAERGYSREFGARELRRTVKTYLEAPLSELIIDGGVRRGHSVCVSVGSDKNLRFRAK